MTVGICGLGLIGGSMAKAYSESGHTVLGYDLDKATLGYASLSEIISGELNEKTIDSCELIFVALYPEATIAYLNKVAPLINKNAVVIDLCGTKLTVCECGFALAEKYGFTFVGGHP
ncbi:MAG: prephenate dehydrogenase/arogenate dehydrogenase family protein, partial [Clostridia bacterium]|nr:prephenate dehydrogenase/arogenate dehydrogenase family protein [Clostridia bacterium]